MSYRAAAKLVGPFLVALCFAAPASVQAQATAIAPYFLVVVDNSGSMSASTGTGMNSCGQTRTRINDARCVMQQVVNAYGDVQFGLMRYNETVTGTCGAPTVTALNCSGCANSGAGCPAAGSTAVQGQLLSPIVAQGSSSVVRWADFTCGTGFDSLTGNPELRADTWTPIAGTVRGARSYFEGTGLFTVVAGDVCASRTTMATCNADTTNNCGWVAGPGVCRVRSPIGNTSTDLCRPVALIFLTDGEETCASDASTTTAINELWNATVGGATRNIPSYWIGFGMAGPDAYIEAFAAAGHTDAPGANRGFYAADETSLALAFSQIVADAILIETCNGRDDDCDTLVDEGFTLYCDLPSHPTQDLCMAPAETLCDSIDNNCNGQVDEGLRNACGTCGPAPLEICDLIDNDCDVAIDEGVCGGCVPSVEICDNLDNDCDGTIDNITRPCGVMVGVCTTGMQTCTAGMWGACTGIGPTPEICDGLDNDCDGSIDGQVQACGSSVGACRPGSQICTMGMLGPCVGAIGPTSERCDNVDNNCNGMTDEGDPGGGGTCGGSIGVCTPGVYHCMAGALMCTGGSSGSAETCNGIDDDCDGSIDEGIPSMGACPGGSTMGVCDPGNLICMGGSFMCVGRVDPRPEICDNLDNNCNGTIDEGNPEGGAMCGDDTGACMSGTTQCMGGVLSCVGAVGPTPEVCNAIDDDCNGVVDDGIPVGAPCGSSLGECMPGVFVCDPATGTLVCQGGISGVSEVCDTLDNDCDGAIDEDVGGGGPCGTDTGECMAGTMQCVGGAIMCVGEIPPGGEVCDCNDNDCDGTVDNPPVGGMLCPTGSACVMCQCASACSIDELGSHCPVGTTPFMHDGTCSCVEPRCDATTCGGQTLMDTSGNVTCAPTPGTDNVGPCVCRNNACTFACEGVTCTGALTCDPRTGACVENSCRALGCPTDELCNTTTGACEPDPCATVTCTSTQACRGGTCEPTCASATCTATQVCHAGVCSTDECMGVSCPTGQVCDPADGTCTSNLCGAVTCSGGQTCDPVTGTCHGDPCVGLHCPSMTECRAGECVRSSGTDGGTNADAGPMPGVDSGMGGGSDAGGGHTTDDRHRVLASGGPLCSVGVAREDQGGTLRALLAGLVIAGVLARRRQRRGGSR